MSLVNSPSSFGYYNNGGFNLPNRYRKGGNSTTWSTRHFQSSDLFKYGFSYLKKEGFRPRSSHNPKFRVDASAGGKIPLPFANLPKPNLPPWVKCVVGLVFSLIQPFWAITGGRLLSFHREVESFVQKVEDVTEIIDDVAESVEKVADEVGERLPEGGWMRKAADCIEEISREVSETADEAIDIINKFQEVSDDVEEFVERLTDGEDEEGKDEKKNAQEVQIIQGKEELQKTAVQVPGTGTIEKDEISAEEMATKS